MKLGGGKEDENDKGYQTFMTLKDTFNAFDKDGNAELGFPEYMEAWKFLGQPGSDADIKTAFDSVDVDGSALIDRDEFLFSIMGEAAGKYGLLADLETASGALDDIMNNYDIIREALNDAKGNAEENARKNAEVRARLENMKSEVQGTMNDLLSKMLGIDPKDVLSKEEIRKHLTEAFNKFDKDSSGELGKWEFTQAWVWLGLKGTEQEIDDAFKSVDSNKSGLIDLSEFITAIESERLMELNLKGLFDKLSIQYATDQQKFEAFQATMTRRRLLKQQMEQKMQETVAKIIERLQTISDVTVPPKDAEQERVYNTLKDTFNAFDKDGSAQLGFPEYVESWKFLDRPGSDADIKKAFDSVDIDKSGLIEWSEFAFSLMGESALNFGPLADMELLVDLLEDTESLLAGLRGSLRDARESDKERAARNAELRARMENMRGEMNGELGAVISKMMSIMGQDPEDLLTDEEITRVLVETFKKFDVDNSNQLEEPEFHKAWKFLGLKGEKDEVSQAFRSVDVDYSGVIDRREFQEAIRNSRTAELSLSVIMTKMDGHLEGLEGFFKSYKDRLEKSKQDALMKMNDAKAQFARFQATARRRRLMKKRYEEEIAANTRKLVQKLGGTDGEENDKGYQMYMTLKDTFNAFDKDGNAELGYPEYNEAWKFLGQPGTDADIKKAFDSVDVDGSCLVEWNEFVFSIMGEKATNYGVLADMEKLHTLMDHTLKEYMILKETLGEVREANDARAEKNAKLRNRLEGMKGEVSSQMNDLISKLMGVNPEDVLSDEEINKHLKEAFDKFETTGDGKLGSWEFGQAWTFLGLKGSESEVNDAFDKVDADKSGLIDFNEFKTAIRSERLMELNLASVLNKLGVNYATSEQRYAAFKKAQDRRRLMKKNWEENVRKMTGKIINQLSAIADTPLPEKDPALAQQYKTLRDTFDAFDKDGSAELGYEEYQEAWKFLGRGDDASECKRVWDSVDVDGSGQIEWSEFA